jgi:hypothetical protein
MGAARGELVVSQVAPKRANAPSDASKLTTRAF